MSTSGQICNREVIHVAREMTLRDAARLMRHFHVGTVVVIDEADGRRTPVGLVTDRDIVMEANAVDLDPGTITVGDIMAQELVTVREDEGLLQVAEIMRYRGVRRLPVVDRENHLVGIISVDDLLAALAEQMAEIAGALGQERRRESRERP